MKQKSGQNGQAIVSTSSRDSSPVPEEDQLVPFVENPQELKITFLCDHYYIVNKVDFF